MSRTLHLIVCLVRWCVCLVLSFGTILLLQAQNQSEIYGHPYFQQYDPEQYHAHKQNWDVVQDPKGIMYFANGDGLLTYDGSSWDLLAMPMETMVQSLDRDVTGQIYVGAAGHFGRIYHDAAGGLHYENLAQSLNDTFPFSRVFSTICLDNAVYFGTMEGIFRYEPDKPLKTWYRGPRALGKLFAIDGSLFLRENQKGLSTLVDDQWEIIPGSERFGAVVVHFMLSLSPGKILLDAGDSLWLYDGNRFSYYPSEAEAYLKRHKIYCALRLEDRNLLVGTVTGGIIGLNPQGRIEFILNGNAQLNTLNIREFYRDHNGDIWVAMDVGLLLLEYPSPFRLYRFPSKNMEFKSFARFNSKLYAASDAGLWKLNRGDGNNFFNKLPGIEYKIWKIDSVARHVLIATDFGLFAMDSEENINLVVPGVCTGFDVSRFDPNRIYIFRMNGFLLLSFTNGKWSYQDVLPDFTGRTRAIVEMSPTEIWLDTDWTELWRIDFLQPSDFFAWQNPQVLKIDSTWGMPPKRGRIYRLDRNLYFVSNDLESNYLWNPEVQKFSESTELTQQLNLNSEGAVIYDVDREGNCWIATGYGTLQEDLALSMNKNGNYKLVPASFNRILKDIGVCATIENNSVWHGGFGTIVHQDLNIVPDYFNFNALIDRVIITDDSVITGSAWADLNPEIRFQKNRIQFHYSCTDFSSASQISYQTYLSGLDTSWTAFSKETFRQFFVLNPGSYTFKVRAMNHENRISEEASYSFSILRPWYCQWWSYALYAGSFISILLGVAKWRNRHLLREKEALENTIEMHTHELKMRNQELLEKTELLAAQSEKLTELDQLKTNLFANISHEFRTPLTLIKAPVEQLENEPDKTLSSDEVGMIRRNADRLLRLVNQLLDLAKLDARSLKLDFTEGDVYRFFRVEASSFSSLAAQKNIDFDIRIPKEQLWASFDREKLETIVYNLLNNAFKFTPAGGQVRLRISHQHDALQLEVTDTGSGIASEHLDQVFDRFYQVEKMGKKSDGGTGIGLALCRELVTLMKGEIKVKSRLNHGTSFYLTIPLVEIINSTFIREDEKIIYRKSASMVSSAPKRQGSAEIVLLVEDHPDMRRHLRSVLEKDYVILEAEDGKSGLEVALQEIPDLIITDTMMPSMDGHEFSQAIKSDERTSHIPVIMLTAKATLENKLVGLSSGVDTYLTKPFNTVELDASIKALLVERKRLRKLFSKQLLVAPKEFVINSMDQQFLERVNTVLESQYSESTFGVPQMQTALVMSKTQLHRKMTAITNQSPGEFLRNFRLQRAAQILVQKGDTVTQVAYSVGFENVPYFTKCFKELFGVPPSQYTGREG